MPEILGRFSANGPASAAPPSAATYAAAAIPARWALERGAWKEAAALETRASAIPYADALTEFARALGAARSGDAASARAALTRLEALKARQAAMNEPYWTQQIEIQAMSAGAWIARAENRMSDALAQMRRAADRRRVHHGRHAPVSVGQALAGVDEAPTEETDETSADRLVTHHAPAHARMHKNIWVERKAERQAP